ncbi:MAG: hypothetical protein ACI4KI_04640 [Candidatus Fimenecus sp.]
MKRIIKSLICLILALIILSSFSTSVFAYEYGSFDVKSLIKVEKKGNTEICSISSENINRIKNSKSKRFKNISDEEKLNCIFEALGFDIGAQQQKTIYKKLSLAQIESIEIKKIYVKVSENGNREVISKNEAIAAAQAKNESLESISPVASFGVMAASDTGPTASHGNEQPIIDPENYMEQSISVIYTPNYNGPGTTPGRYFVMAGFNWLTPPSKRHADCMGMYSNQFNWVDRIPGEDSNYGFFVSFYKYVYDGNGNIASVEEIADELDEDNATISNPYGFCFEYNLKNNFLQIRYDGFNFLIFGVCRVIDYNNVYQSLSMSSEYIHINSLVSISPSFSVGPVGISISSNSTKTQKFTGSHEWDYYNDYYA